jgi:hypothetical protein
LQKFITRRLCQTKKYPLLLLMQDSAIWIICIIEDYLRGNIIIIFDHQISQFRNLGDGVTFQTFILLIIWSNCST